MGPTVAIDTVRENIRYKEMRLSQEEVIRSFLKGAVVFKLFAYRQIVVNHYATACYQQLSIT